MPARGAAGVQCSDSNHAGVVAGHACRASTMPCLRLFSASRQWRSAYSRYSLINGCAVAQRYRFSNASSLHSHQVRYSTSDLTPTDTATVPNHPPYRPKRIVVGITGATGTVYAVRLLEVLHELGIETHLVMSKWALTTLKYETDRTESQLHALATRVYTARDMTAPIASGSFLHDGMIIVPCSMKTLAAVRIGFCDDLISRAADVTLKERRTLMLVPRETPLSDIHLENLLAVRKMGAVVFPPMPAFYTRPKSLEDLINQSIGRMLDNFGIHTEGFERWNGCDWSKK